MSVRSRTISYVAAAAITALAIIVASTALLGAPSAPGTTAVFAIRLTDPPVVPTGTTSLNMTYSNVGVHVAGGAGSGWVTANSTGTVDLLQMINVSKTIAAASVPNGSVVNAVRFNINDVKVAVNGTIYDVTVPNDQLNVPIVGAEKISNVGAALLDLSPRVFAMEVDNHTVYFMVPSAKATLSPATSVANGDLKVGHQGPLTPADNQGLSNATGSADLSSLSLSSTGNSTNLAITVKNTGNVALSISSVKIHGDFNESFVTAPGNSQGKGNGKGNGQWMAHPDEVNFLVNGTSLVQLKGNEGDGSVTTSLTLAPGQSVTLTFSSVITLGGKGNPQMVVSIPGNTYSVLLDFTDGVELALNVVAK